MPKIKGIMVRRRRPGAAENANRKNMKYRTIHKGGLRGAHCCGGLCLNAASLLVGDLLVATVLLPLALSPVVLEVVHLVAVVNGLVVVQSLLETALATLAQTEEHEASNADGTDDGCANVDSDVRSLAEIVPLLGEALSRGFVQFGQSGGVSSVTFGQ
jgi:hypothetical protein